MRRLRSSAKIDWYQTFTGRKFNPIFATARDIHIEDIAHALSQICRYGGHCRRFYSVGQHSVLCALHAAPGHEFQALMHDATEAYIGDMVLPLKNQIRKFRTLEGKLWRIIAERYQMAMTLSHEVKIVDRQALGAERRDLLDNHRRYHWKVLEGVRVWPEEIVPWSSRVAERRFLKMFAHLYPKHVKALKEA